jgi:hypothetical protein
MRVHVRLLPLAGGALLAACSSLTIRGVDFGWPVESVLTVDSNNRIEERRYGLAMNVASLASAEFQDTTALLGTELRILRSAEGYYFMTGRKFRHVYVFGAGESELGLISVVEVTANGLREPAMNQRPPYVELLDGGSARTLLSAGGIVEGPTP